MSELNFLMTKSDSASAENIERSSLEVDGDQVTFRQYIPSGVESENKDTGVPETGEEGKTNIYTSVVSKNHMGCIVARNDFELDETTSKLLD